MDELRFDGRAFVVTGAGTGMGRAHALLLARRGAAVAVNDYNESAALSVVEEITEAGGTSIAATEDISRWSSAKSVIDKAVAEFGRIDGLVNNAAVLSNISMAELTPELVDRHLQVNAHGTFYVTLAAWPHFVAANFGRVVCVSSDSALLGQSHLAAYASSKGAVLGMVRSLAQEGREHGILVNGVMPGAFTAMAKAAASPEDAVVMEKRLPPELVSPAVAWLLHERNRDTGEVWQVAAGRVARLLFGYCRGFWKADLTMEDVAAHLEEIRDAEGFYAPADTNEALMWMMSNTGWNRVAS